MMTECAKIQAGSGHHIEFGKIISRDRIKIFVIKLMGRSIVAMQR